VPNAQVADVVVVVPAYKAVRTIDAALASVAFQGLAPQHVVVVDDGSDDGTLERLSKWKAHLPLTVVSQPNAGPAAARRRALEESDERLVALLDADDVWLPDHLESLVRAHERVGGIVTADAFDWVPGRQLSATRRRLHPIPPADEQRAGILLDNFVFVSSVFTRDAYDEAGGFRDGFTGAEDWDLWIRMVRLGVVVTGAPGPTVLYRRGVENLTSSVAVYDRYLAVLIAAADGCQDDQERAIIAERQRWFWRRRELALAYQAAAAGHSARARSHAVSAWPGSLRMSVECAALLLSPKIGVALARRVKGRTT